MNSLGGALVVGLAAVGVVLDALVEVLDRGVVVDARDEDAHAHRGVLAGIDLLLARAVGLIAHADGLDGVRAGLDAGQAQRRALVDDALAHAVDEDLGGVHVGLDDEVAELRRRQVGGLDVGGVVGQHHVGVEAAALAGGVLLLLRGEADVGVDVLGELVGGDHAVAVGVGLAFEALDDVVGEDAVAAAPVGALKALLAVAAGGEREERLLQVEQRGVDRGAVVELSACGVMAPEWQASVMSTFHLPLILRADVRAEGVHGVGGRGDVVDVHVIGREVRLAGGDEAVAGEVDQHAVVVLGDGGQPDLQLVADVGDGRLLIDELVDVLRGELAAFGADECGVHVLGVAVGVL